LIILSKILIPIAKDTRFSTIFEMILLQLIVLYLSSISQVTALLAYRFLAQTSDEFIQAKFSEKITREDAVMRLSESQLGKNSERHIVPVKNGPTTLTVIEDRQVDKSLEESIEDNGGILDCLTFSPGVEIPLQKFEYLPASRFENGYPIILPEEVSRKNYDDFSVLKVLRNAIALYDNSECQYDAIGLLAGNPIRVTPPLEGSPVLSIGVITPLVAEDWLKNGIQRYTPQWHSKIVVNLSEDEITALSKFKIQATEPTSSPRRKTPTKYSSPQKKLKNQSENGSDDESVSNMLAKLKLSELCPSYIQSHKIDSHKCDL